MAPIPKEETQKRVLDEREEKFKKEKEEIKKEYEARETILRTDLRIARDALVSQTR